MPWIEFLSGRTCILLWILYGNMVDFSFIVSLYVSDLLNVTIKYSTVAVLRSPAGVPSRLPYLVLPVFYRTLPVQQGFYSYCTVTSTVRGFVPGAAYLGCYMHAVHSMLSLPAMSHRGAVNLCAWLG